MSILGEVEIAARDAFPFARDGQLTPDESEQFEKLKERQTTSLHKLNTQHFLYRALLGERVSARLEEMNRRATHWNVWVKAKEFEEALYAISRFAREDLFLDEVSPEPK